MKTIKYIATILMIFAINSITLSGQTASRSDSKQKSGQSTVKRVTSKEQVEKTARTTQPASRSVSKEPERARTTQPASRSVSREPERARTTQPASRSVSREPEHVETPRLTDRPVSISTERNQRSGYRSPGSKEYAKERARYENKLYYSGRYYHNVYPAVNVHVHHHHDTYLHNYRVLYYPPSMNIYWTRNMFRDYSTWYPNYNWRYDYGYRIQTISVFDAKYNLGEVAMIYGRVSATWYNEETDDYLLFFGGDFPYQQFTAVLPGRIARKFNWRPENYFLGKHLTITGLLTTYDGIPEVIVKNGRQVGIY
jgi:hypothetical protein